MTQFNLVYTISTAWLWACSPALKLQYIFYKSSGFSRLINRWLQCRMHPGEKICCPFSPCHYLFLTGPDADVTTLAYLNNISRCCLHCRDGGTQIGCECRFRGHNQSFWHAWKWENVTTQTTKPSFTKAWSIPERWTENFCWLWAKMSLHYGISFIYLW